MSEETASTPDTGAASTVEGAANALLARMEANDKARRKPAEPSAEGDDAQETPDEDGSDAETDDAETDTDDTDDSEAGDEQDDKPATQTYKVKVNGEEQDVTLEELQKGYMMSGDYGKKSREVAEARKAVMAEREQGLSRINETLQETGFLAQTFMQQLTNVEQTTNWDELRQQNPAEYAARKHDLEQRKQLLARSYTAYQQAQQIQQAHAQQQTQQRLADEAERLTAKIPEWLDADKAQAEKAALAKYLGTSDFAADEIDQLVDHRVVVMARKAMLFDQMQNDRKAVQKKVERTVPQLVRGGVKPASGKAENLNRATKQMRSSGSIDAAAQWLLTKTGT